MKKIKTLVILVVLMALLSNMTAFAQTKTSAIKVTVNKKTVKYDASPYLTKGEVMIPLEETAEAIGAEVEWNKKNKTAWVHFNMTHMEFVAGKKEFYIHRDNDFSGIPQTVKLNTPIKNSSNSLFVPGKTVFESIGMNVSWDSKKKVLSITGELDSNKEIKYTEIAKDDIAKIKSVYSWYNKNYTKAGIHSMTYKGTMYMLASAGKKPTGGFTIGIEAIAYKSDTKAVATAIVKAPDPDMMVTQVETYPHILVKIEGHKKLKSISGKVNEITIDPIPALVQYEEITYDNINNNKKLTAWYSENNQKQGISYIKDGKYIYALIAAGEKNTGGYTIHIDNIYYSTADTVVIQAKVASPDNNSGVIMMLTYPSMLIRIKSESIKTVIGDVMDTKISGVSLDLANVTKLELLDLNQVKLYDVIGAEKDEIIQSFNEAIVDFNPYIRMIAGKVLKVTTTDGYIMTFSSYGSETNVIANLERDGFAKTYHLLAPGIAKYICK